MPAPLVRYRVACIRSKAGHRWLPLLGCVLTALVVPALGARAASQVPSPSTASLSEPPIGMHSMLYLNTPYSAMRAMFQQASDAAVTEIRLDIELSDVFPGSAPSRRGRRVAVSRLSAEPGSLRASLHNRGPAERNPLDHPSWGGIDEYMRLARAYHLHVLAVLTATPGWMADCPRGTSSAELYRCPPRETSEWGRAVSEIAAHTSGVINTFEILNEPDGHWSFLGTPQQYAGLLASSFDALHAANPAAQVVLGGLMHLGTTGIRWMNQMLATPGTYADQKFDVANIHVRLPPAQAGPTVCRWKRYFGQRGFHGPLWVTETGYPASRARQTDTGYRSGLVAQARWLGRVIPTLLANGAAKVFVTERDLSHGDFASEGVLQTRNPLPDSPKIRRRPSFYTVQRLARGAWMSAEVHAARTSSGGC